MKQLLVLLLFSPFLAVSAQGLNAGFVQGVWYSKTPFFAGETVRIYTAIQNNSGADIEGKVVFLVNGTPIGETSFAAINGRIIEAWTDWDVTQGTHQVAAQITEAVKKEIGKDPEPITLGSLASPADEVVVDADTDGDGVGNLEDTDDDNDGFTDEEEQLAGTDPLDPDSYQEPAQEQEQETEVQDIESPLTEFTKKVTDEYLGGFGQGVDEKIEETIQGLKAQREDLATKETQESLTTTDKALDLLLASAIVALPEWRFGLFLFFGFALAFLARRLGT